MEPLDVTTGSSDGSSALSGRVLRELEVHSALEDRWYEAKVLCADATRLFVCRKGWPRSFAEWLPRTSNQLAPATTHLGRWREFQVHQAIQIGFRQNPNDSAASHWVPGTIHAVARDLCGVSEVEVEWEGVGLVLREWRDADDDFLVPPGLPVYSLSQRCC